MSVASPQTGNTPYTHIVGTTCRYTHQHIISIDEAGWHTTATMLGVFMHHTRGGTGTRMHNFTHFLVTAPAAVPTAFRGITSGIQSAAERSTVVPA